MADVDFKCGTRARMGVQLMRMALSGDNGTAITEFGGLGFRPRELPLPAPGEVVVGLAVVPRTRPVGSGRRPLPSLWPSGVPRVHDRSARLDSCPADTRAPSVPVGFAVGQPSALAPVTVRGRAVTR